MSATSPIHSGQAGIVRHGGRALTKKTPIRKAARLKGGRPAEPSGAQSARYVTRRVAPRAFSRRLPFRLVHELRSLPFPDDADGAIGIAAIDHVVAIVVIANIVDIAGIAGIV